MILMNTIAGDIIGSKYEFNNIKTKDFELFQDDMHYTDDTVMTIATANALLEIDEKYKGNYSLKDENNVIEIFKYYYHKYGNLYNDPALAYGVNFYKWLLKPYKKAYPYNSLGNGSAMRVSPVGWYAKNDEDAIFLARCSAFPTHNHPLGIKGAVDISLSIHKLINGVNPSSVLKESIYPIKCKCDNNLFDETCEGTIPYVYMCFADSLNVEDAIRNAISIGGDSDTIGIITASLAEAYYFEDENISKNVERYLNKEFIKILKDFDELINKRLNMQ